MADINQLIVRGIGPDSDIEHLILHGLSVSTSTDYLLTVDAAAYTIATNAVTLTYTPSAGLVFGEAAYVIAWNPVTLTYTAAPLQTTQVEAVRGAYPGIGHRTNLSLVLGTDVSQPFVILDRTGSAAVDISSFGFSFAMKRGLEDSDDEALVLITAYVVSGTYDPDPEANTQLVTIPIADTETDTLDPGSVHWELKRTTVGAESRLAYGRMRLIRGVHRG